MPTPPRLLVSLGTANTVRLTHRHFPEIKRPGCRLNLVTPRVLPARWKPFRVTFSDGPGSVIGTFETSV